MWVWVVLGLALLESVRAGASFEIDGMPSVLEWSNTASKVRLMKPFRKSKLVLQSFNALKEKWTPIALFGEEFVMSHPLITTSPLNIYESLSVQSTRQWSLVHIDDFQRQSYSGPSSPPWIWNSDVSSISTCGDSSDRFLGGSGEFSDFEAVASLTEIAQHSSLKLKARFHFIDNWKGETIVVKIDGKVVWTKSHSHCDSKFFAYLLFVY